MTKRMQYWQNDHRHHHLHHQHHLSYEEIAASGSARPLEFPAPVVQRGARITVNSHDRKSGRIHSVKNVLVRIGRCSEHFYRHCDGGTLHQNGDAVAAAALSVSAEAPPVSPFSASMEVSEVGYCLRQKISKSVYGSVFKCVVMKRRELFLRDTVTASSSAGGGISYRNEGSLESINEGEDHYSEDEFSAGKIVWEPTGEVVAVKMSSWSKMRKMRGMHLEEPLREIQAMQLVGNYHNHIIGNVEVLQDDKYLYSVMPYCDGGDLYGAVMSEIKDGEQGRLKESHARIWFRQILLALHHLQLKGVCHRDISLENIMVHRNECKLIDFGMSLRVPYSDPGNINTATDASAGTQRLLMTAQGQGGTKWTYMAPEVVKRCEVFDGFAIDLWAAAVVLYIMLIGHVPFRWAQDSDEQFWGLSGCGMLRENLEHWNIGLSDEACDLLQNMLWRDVTSRLTLAQVMEHPWVIGTDDDDRTSSTTTPEEESENNNSANGSKSSYRRKLRWLRKGKSSKSKSAYT